MNRRQQYLIGAIVGLVVLWQSSGLISSILIEPFQTRSRDFDQLKKSVTERTDKLLQLARSSKSLAAWKASSLPPDPGKSKQPTALNVQRQYIQWLTDLGELCGFEDLIVQAGSPAVNGKVFIPVVVKLDASARFEQLTQFLDLFYRTDLLHRVSSMHVTTKEFEGDPRLKVILTAEGLALLDAAPRRTLFPITELAAKLSNDDTTIQVVSAKDFPKKAGFRIKIKNEILNVTDVDNETWKVTRGVERTQANSYGEKAPIELLPMKAGDSDRTLAEFRELIANNIFVKPAPPYKMKFGPLGEKAFPLGRPVEFTIAAQGFDTLLGKPEFAVVGDAPKGLKIDRFGKLTWRPDRDTAVGKYPVKFEARHPSAPDGVMTETVTIRLRDPVAAPKLANATPPTVYLNREWAYKPEFAASEANLSKITWKLGDKSPKGLKINDKTGELKWLPGDDVAIGETTVPLIATDGDSPPQSTTISLKLNVLDDAAQFTKLTGIIAFGSKRLATLTDQSADRIDRVKQLHEGDKFAIADLSGTIKTIRGRYLIMKLGQDEIRWELGQSLREAQENIKEY